jgi:hypothetical protein
MKCHIIKSKIGEQREKDEKQLEDKLNKWLEDHPGATIIYITQSAVDHNTITTNAVIYTTIFYDYST